MVIVYTLFFTLFFVHATASSEIYTLSLHDALPILLAIACFAGMSWGLHRHSALFYGSYWLAKTRSIAEAPIPVPEDRKSTRLNSSHPSISYAVFCLKKKKKAIQNLRHILLAVALTT